VSRPARDAVALDPPATHGTVGDVFTGDPLPQWSAPPPRMSWWSRRPPVILLIPAALGAALFVLPLAGLLLKMPWDQLVILLEAPEARTALWLSLLCSLSATALCVLLGVPLAWVQQRTRMPGRALLRAVTTLPVVLPPVAGGVALLYAFGSRGLVGSWLHDTLGIQLTFSTAGVVIAETFVAMPFLVLTMNGALQSADPRLEEAARTFGASRWTVFWRVTMPMVRPSLIAGTVLSWARALGEFGATITFAGNFPGRTQTMPLAVYLALETDPDAAVALSLVLVVISLIILVSLRRRWVGQR
jgi:molybdate transport system permease protein